METVTPQVELDQNSPDRRVRRRELPNRAFAVLIAAAAVVCFVACKQALVVGEYQCPKDDAAGGIPPSDTDPITLPWETGFEEQFCDYQRVAGYCYSWPPVEFRVVRSPVHSGQYAAEITVTTGIEEQPQGRCVRQGILPTEAYYGVWFYIPETATNAGLWNLLHFQGGTADKASLHGLWDVSLANGPTGALNLVLFSFQNGTIGNSPPIPIGRWFHVVLYLKRAKDRSGAVALYLNEERVVEATNLVTDDSDWGQWYVGNLASDLQPPKSIVYLDDITIRSTL